MWDVGNIFQNQWWWVFRWRLSPLCLLARMHVWPVSVKWARLAQTIEELFSHVAPLICIMLGGGVSKGEGSHHAWTGGSKKFTHDFELPALSQAILENEMWTHRNNEEPSKEAGCIVNCSHVSQPWNQQSMCCCCCVFPGLVLASHRCLWQCL